MTEDDEGLALSDYKTCPIKPVSIKARYPVHSWPITLGGFHFQEPQRQKTVQCVSWCGLFLSVAARTCVFSLAGFLKHSSCTSGVKMLSPDCRDQHYWSTQKGAE
ncbi:hypothetical protein Baya_2387 [Bagarius yarrelli]|uniref:Uncharacterized protein n=1 Tax=Bagarius yarrelli TaxID=175774 RepID=A0A556TNT4_BAGYA|nr:hypothetical protein Baya_2387 [Bagarius yarrelli]